MTDLTKYPFDPTGKSPTNKVSNEVHSIGGSHGKVIVPKHAPFYGQGLLVATESGRVLDPETEYTPIYMYRDATNETGITVFTAIVIKNEILLGDVMVSYQTVGGEYSSVGPAIVEAVAALNTISLDVYWEDIKFKPEEFNPSYHKHHSRDLIGMKETVEGIHGVEEAIRERIVAGIDSRVSLLGHTKLIVDEGHINTHGETGPVVLTFGRSSNQRGRISLELGMLSDAGSAFLQVTAWEEEDGFDHIRYDSLGPIGFNLPMALYSDDPGYSKLVIGDENTIWGEEVFLYVKSITVSSLDVDAYRHNWVWAFAENGETFPELTVPSSNQDTVDQDIENIQTSLVAIASLLNTHIQDKNNPHEVGAEDVELGQVENFEASTDYKDTSEQLYATAKSVSDLDNATSEEISQASEDLLEAITVTLDPGRTF